MKTDVIEELYLSYQNEIYIYLFSLCKNRELAEDILQDTFVKAMLSLSDKHSNKRAWLYFVARNLYLNRAKKLSREVGLDEAQEVAVSADMLESIIEDENNRLLYKAMQRLSEQKREILTLQYWGGFSQKEIAALMNMTPENIRVLGYRGKKDLKKILEDEGYDIS